jgi:hypothetical protein
MCLFEVALHAPIAGLLPTAVTLRAQRRMPIVDTILPQICSTKSIQSTNAGEASESPSCITYKNLTFSVSAMASALCVRETQMPYCVLPVWAAAFS